MPAFTANFVVLPLHKVVPLQSSAEKMIKQKTMEENIMNEQTLLTPWERDKFYEVKKYRRCLGKLKKTHFHCFLIRKTQKNMTGLALYKNLQKKSN